MEADVSSHLGPFYLKIDRAHQDYLMTLRHLEHLKIAYVDEVLWVTNFSNSEITGTAVKQIPHAEVFYAKSNKLYRFGSLLPSQQEPGLLWVPVQQAFPLEFTNYNHNFFGINEEVSIALVPAEDVHKEVAMITTLDTLEKYLSTIASIRYSNHQWAIINDQMAIVVGEPLLSIEGQVYWNREEHLLPVGYDFDLYNLSEHMNTRLNPENANWIIWNSSDNSYSLVPKSALRPLSLSSFRKSTVKNS